MLREGQDAENKIERERSNTEFTVKNYRYSSMFAILEVRDFASSRSNFSIPFLEVRDVNFASSRFLHKMKPSNHYKSAELTILQNKMP